MFTEAARVEADLLSSALGTTCGGGLFATRCARRFTRFIIIVYDGFKNETFFFSLSLAFSGWGVVASRASNGWTHYVLAPSWICLTVFHVMWYNPSCAELSFAARPAQYGLV